MNDNFNKCPVPPNYTPDKPIIRNHLDKISNYHGTLLISLCKDVQLKLLNGRFLRDSLGFYTFHNTNGQSTVDYMLATTRLFYDVQHFIVKPPVEFSDHCLLSVFLEVYVQREVTQRLNSDFGKFQWDNSMSDNYHNNLLQQDSVNDILSLLEVIDTDNSDIDHVLSKVNDIYIKAASNTMI